MYLNRVAKPPGFFVFCRFWVAAVRPALPHCLPPLKKAPFVGTAHPALQTRKGDAFCFTWRSPAWRVFLCLALHHAGLTLCPKNVVGAPPTAAN